MAGDRRRVVLRWAALAAIPVLVCCALWFLIPAIRSTPDRGDVSVVAPRGSLASPLPPAPSPPAIALVEPAPAAGSAALLDEPGYFTGVPEAWVPPFVATGCVVDAAGAALAGARIVLMPDRITRTLVEVTTGERDRSLPFASTDDDGRFRLATRRGLPGVRGVSRIDAYLVPSVVVVDPRCALTIKSCPLSWTDGGDLGTIVVRAGAELRGRVVDEAGRPMAGASVSVECTDRQDNGWGRSETFGELPDALRETLSGDDGTFRFAGVWPGGVTVCVDEWKGISPTRRIEGVEAGAIVAVGDLVLRRGLTITGRVTNTAGEPLPGGRALALADWRGLDRPEGRRNAWLSMHDAPSSARCDADGRFMIDDLRSADAIVLAGADGFVPAVLGSVWPGGPAVSFQLAAEGRIELAIVDADGQPVPDASMPRPDGYGPRIEPLEPGRFLVHDASGSGLTLRIEASGFATTLDAVGPAQAGSTEQQTVVLRREAVLAGRVVDDVGAPVAGAWLCLQSRDDLDWSMGVAADREGRFRITGVIAGRHELGVRASAHESASVQLDALLAGEERTDLALVSPRCGAIEGVVRCTDGTVPRRGQAPELALAGVMEDPTRGAQVGSATVFDERGRFRFDALVPGRHVLTTRFGTSNVVEVRPGETSACDIVAARLPVVRGRVLCATGPVSGAIVRAKNRESYRRDIGGLDQDEPGAPGQLTDANGNYALVLDGEGEFLLRAVAASGGMSAEVPVHVVRDQECRIDLTLESGRIEGVVVDALTGAPLSGAAISIDRLEPVAAAGDGHFVLEQLLAGEHSLTATAPGHLDQAFPPIRLSAGQVLGDVSLAVQPAATLRITLLTPDGRVVGGDLGISLTFVGDEKPTSRNHWRGEVVDGVAVVSGLPAGRYLVSSDAPGIIAADLGDQFIPKCRRLGEVAVAVGETHAVTLRIPMGE